MKLTATRFGQMRFIDAISEKDYELTVVSVLSQIYLNG
jgi:hypothetical protein